MTLPGRRPLRLGMLGAGMIATAPFGFLPGLQVIRERVEVVAIASRTRSLAESVAAQWSIPAVYDDLTAMLGHADLDAVLNVTPIPVHFETSLQILQAGMHLVTDKPVASSVAEADTLCQIARDSGRLIVSAPFDMLTGEYSAARRIVQSGALGRVAFARVQSSHAGPAALAWPVDPSWFYQKGAGPLLDMGVYGIDRITGILGPARRVSALSGLIESLRRARGGPFDGLTITAGVDDNTLLLLDFGGGVFASVDATYNVTATRSAPVEIFGTEGTLIVKRPGAPVAPGKLALELFSLNAAAEPGAGAGSGVSAGHPGWSTPDAAFESTGDRTVQLQRASLVEHLLDCLDTGSAPLASGEKARHVLEIMLAARESARSGRVIELATTF